MTLDLLFITFRHTVATAAADTALTAALTYISGCKHLYTHSNIKILPWTCWLWILCLRWPYHPSSTTSCGSKWRIKGGSTSLCVKWAPTAASHIDHRSRLPVTHHLTPALCPWPCVCFLYKCQWKCCCTCMSTPTEGSYFIKLGIISHVASFSHSGISLTLPGWTVTLNPGVSNIRIGLPKTQILSKG